jgi:hypothetical protein
LFPGLSPSRCVRVCVDWSWQNLQWRCNQEKWLRVSTAWSPRNFKDSNSRLHVNIHMKPLRGPLGIDWRWSLSRWLCDLERDRRLPTDDAAVFTVRGSVWFSQPHVACFLVVVYEVGRIMDSVEVANVESIAELEVAEAQGRPPLQAHKRGPGQRRQSGTAGGWLVDLQWPTMSRGLRFLRVAAGVHQPAALFQQAARWCNCVSDTRTLLPQWLKAALHAPPLC